MELSSRLDFEREERVRQRKLDEFDNIDKQLDKEVESGRLSEKEIEAYRLKNNLAREGMNVPLSTLLRQGDKEEQFGMPPYWEEYFKPEYTGTKEREYAEAKRRDVISGRTGTRPWYLDPEMISTTMGRQAQEAAGIFLTDAEIQEALKAQPSNVMQPSVKISTDAEYNALPNGTHFITPDGQKGIKGSGGR